jgi:HD-GYP domain-containing protein (c-di-GMP phosphodiesterase class II)
VDVFDALTTSRSYRGALTVADALGRMQECRTWWRPDIFEAFLRSIGRMSAAA